MIIETVFEDRPELIERYSDRGVYIRKSGTDEEYASAVDYTNAWRVSHGLEPYKYEETDVPVEDPETEQTDTDKA